MSNLTLGSLFDGSGGFPLAGLINGITPLWASEIEPFPIRVTTKRLPEVKHYGDINKMNGAEIEPVDIITFGSPCTNLSVAGRREGLEGEQSSLFFEATRIIREMREATNGQKPRYILWENVPGALSSSESNDFRCVLEEIVKIKDETALIPMPDKNKWLPAGEIMGTDYSVAWRVLDAQYWGVPQRRRRIFLVADFAGERAGTILFESESVSGNTTEGGGARQRASGDAEEGATPAIGIDGYNQSLIGDAAQTIRAGRNDGDHTGMLLAPADCDCLTPWDVQSRRIHGKDGVWPALYGGEGGGHGYVADTDAADCDSYGLVSKGNGDCFLCPERHMALTAGGGQAGQGFPCVMQSAGFCTEHSAKSRGVGFEDEKSPTLRAGVIPGAVLSVENHPADSRMDIDESGTVQTLTSRMGTGGGNVPMVMNERQYALTVGEDVANTLSATDYKGTQCVFEDMSPKTLKIRSGCEGGGKGALIQDDKSATLGCNNDQTLFEPKAYGICSKESNSMKSGNPNSGIYEADTSRTLDANGGNPSCNQGGMAVVEPVVYDTKQVTSPDNRSNPKPGAPCHTLASGNADSAVVCLEGNGARPSHHGDGFSEDGVAYTLNTVERHAIAYDCRNHEPNEVSATLQAKNNGGHSLNYINPVVYALDRAAYNQGQNAQFNISVQDDDTAPTVLAKGPGAVASFYPQMKAESQCYREDDTANTLVNGTNPGYQNGVMESGYAVRRLTPLECCRLQGFPDWWCEGLHTDDPTDVEVDWWTEVFETHRYIIGTSSKPKSRSQIIKWLKDPYSDSAEYKMWGNGIALPCAVFVLGGIAWADGLPA